MQDTTSRSGAPQDIGTSPLIVIHAKIPFASKLLH